MLRLTEIKLALEHSPEVLRLAVAQRLHLSDKQIENINIFRRGYDARKRSNIFLIYTLDVKLKDAQLEEQLLTKFARKYKISRTPDMNYKFVSLPQNIGEIKNKLTNRTVKRPVVVGFGPCGIFAGLILAQMGLCPIILERGKSVRERTKDTWELWRQNQLNPESNVQFGEGGAGTFSDGKLYSQIKDPNHYARKVLEEFVKAGAPEEILYVSKPHIGTFRLVSMVEKIRQEIISLGGEVRFEQRVVDFEINSERKIVGLKLASGEEINAEQVILALGHSARDTFTALHKRGVFMEAKAFSIGLRIEHPQTLIDKARFGQFAGNKLLGSADYKLAHKAKIFGNERGVYSFCMCPGGQVVAASSEVGCVVTNGMSQYSRNEHNANSALVVDVQPEDFSESNPQEYKNNPLLGIEFQRQWERRAFALGGGDYRAPVQRLGDFLLGLPTTHLGSVLPSYQPGVQLSELSKALPEYVIAALRQALPVFDQQITGFAMPDALLTGVETRTSSPLRIKRNEGGEFSGQSINTQGLYPAGEGAGYAGGIMSAAIDGIKMAQEVAGQIGK